ncbi:efflux RND transporter permease subunit [Halanaerocella petrolearia]
MNKILKWPWIVIAIISIITIFLAIQVPNIKINNAVKIFLPHNHPAKVNNEQMEEIYGSSDVIAVAIKSKKGAILSKDNIVAIEEITSDLEEIVNVDEVTSLTNADYIEGTAEGMKVNELVTESIANKEKLKDKLISWDLYKDNLYTDELNATQISIKLKSELTINEKEEVYFKIQKKLKKYKDSNFKFHIAGSPAINVLMGNNMESDLKRLIPFVIGVVLISLYLSFKNLGGVVLPILTVLISTIWTLGIMALLNIQLTMVSTVIPVLLVAVGSAYGIHIISHYYDDLREKNEKMTEDEHRQVVLETVTKVGKPVLLAGLTTIVGFGSLGTSNIVPIKEFGIFTAVGVATALIVALTLIPAILLVRHNNLQYDEDENGAQGFIDKVILGLYHYFSKKRIRVLVLALIIIIISSYGMSQIVIDNIMIKMFKEDTKIRQGDKFINNNFAGTNILNVLVDGEDKGSLTNPEVLKQMEGLKSYLTTKYDEVGKVTSVADFIKRMNKVMNYPQEETTVAKSNSNKSITSEETTNSFGKESTTEFGTETTSDFEQETTSSFGAETTSDFGGQETTSDFGTKDKVTSQQSKESSLDSKSPSQEKISEKEMVSLLNKAIIKAKKLNLTGEELVEAINKELNYKGAAYNEIPYDPAKYSVADRKQLKNLISQYLLMYSGSLDDLINDQLEPSKARIMVQIKTGSNIVTKKIKEDIKNYVAENFPEGYQISVTGHANMSLAVNNLIVSSQITSILISLVIVFLIVALNYKSIIAGFYGIIPLSISLLINFGVMGFAGIRLDIATSMVASIAIGIGVDYTVHFLAEYYHQRQQTDDLEVVCQNTLLTSGKAIIFNAVSVAAGFSVLLFSNFTPLINLGLLVTLTMITSSLAAMTILPALLNLFKPKFIKKGAVGGKEVDSLNF